MPRFSGAGWTRLSGSFHPEQPSPDQSPSQAGDLSHAARLGVDSSYRERFIIS